MFLLTFISLLIGLIGIYAEVISLQATQMYANQTGYAQTLVAWHNAAVSMGQVVPSIPASGVCSLTYLSSASLAMCAPPSVTNPHTTINGTVTDSSNNLNYIADYKTVNLPTGYDTIDYQFNSVLYTDTISGRKYVATIVLPPTVSATNPAPGYVKGIPSGVLLGFTLSNLNKQLSNLGVPTYSYGTISYAASLTITAAPYLSAAPTIYTLPTVVNTALSPNGGIAIVTGL